MTHNFYPDITRYFINKHYYKVAKKHYPNIKKIMLAGIVECFEVLFEYLSLTLQSGASVYQLSR